MLPMLWLVMFTGRASHAAKQLYLMGLLPFTGNEWPAGKTLHAAMTIALEEINSMESVLEGYHLNLLTADTKVSCQTCLLASLMCSCQK